MNNYDDHGAAKAEEVKDTERLEWWATNSRDYFFKNPCRNYWIVYIGKGWSLGGVPYVEGKSLREVTDLAIAKAKS